MDAIQELEHDYGLIDAGITDAGLILSNGMLGMA